MIHSFIKKSFKRFLLSIGLSPAGVKRLFVGFDLSYDECKLVSGYLLEAEKKRDGILIDVGAAWGGASEPFIRAGWQVYAFEPDNAEDKVATLKSLLKYTNFHLDLRAVSDSSGKEVEFFISDESPGISSLHDFKDHYFSHIVETVSLTDYLAENRIDSVDYLKVDTEGHDIFVLRGFPFDKFKPIIIIVEFDELKTVPLGISYRDLAKILVDSGYIVYMSEWYPIIRYGEQHKFRRLVKYPNELQDAAAWGNFIAVSPDHKGKFDKYLTKKIPGKYRK